MMSTFMIDTSSSSLLLLFIIQRAGGTVKGDRLEMEMNKIVDGKDCLVVE